MAVSVFSQSIGATDIYHSADRWEVDSDGSLRVANQSGEVARYAQGAWSRVHAADGAE